MAKVLTICILPIRDRPRHFHKLIVFLIDSRVFQKFSSSLFLASLPKTPRILMMSQRLFISKCPSKKDPLFTNANASVLSLFTLSLKTLRKLSGCRIGLSKTYHVFNEAGHIIRKESEFNNFFPYPNTLNVIIVSHLNS